MQYIHFASKIHILVSMCIFSDVDYSVLELLMSVEVCFPSGIMDVDGALLVKLKAPQKTYNRILR